MAAGSPCSLRDAATAAAALAAVEEVTLFRRDTRWFAFTAPRETEWECCREELVCRTGAPVWANGRDTEDSCRQEAGAQRQTRRESRNWELTLKDAMISSQLFFFFFFF